MSGVSASAETRLLRRTRGRLVAWSGGLTLAVLVVLGPLIYISVARALAEAATADLDQRVGDIVPLVVADAGGPVESPGATPVVGPAIGISFLGPAAGSLALVVEPDGKVAGVGDVSNALGLPDRESLAAARAEGTDVRERQVAGLPVRMLSRAVDTARGTYVVQVVQGLEAELRALETLRAVLVVGGTAVVIAALIVGWVYADRALVPIRDSMRRQREFAADAGHELRTPLTIVKGAVEEARRQPRAVAAPGGPLDEIDIQADRLAELVDELLIFARVQAGTLELEQKPVRLDEVTVETVERFQRFARANSVQLQTDLLPITLLGDPRRLSQLIGVLVDNAIRHSPPGGLVTVSVGQDGGGATIAVNDQGPGIPPHEIGRIFERYYRAQGASAGGLGLGLAIAKWITDGHGGTITATNRPTGGASFRVKFPLR